MSASFLALDLGEKTGWAVGDWYFQKHIASGTVSVKPTRFQSHGQRFVDFRNHISKLHQKYEFSYCFFEEVRRHIGTDAAHAYGGYGAILQSWCIDNNIPYKGTPVGTIKKHITGKGNAGKEDVIMAVKTKLGIFPKDDNEADAIALCDYHLTNPNG